MTTKTILIAVAPLLFGIAACTTDTEIDTPCTAGEIFDETRSTCVPSSL